MFFLMSCLIVMIYKGAGLLGKTVLVARGVGTGFDQGLKKFLQEKLDRSAPDSAEERRELVKDSSGEPHGGGDFV